MSIQFEVKVVSDKGRVLFTAPIADEYIPLFRGKTKQHISELYPTVPGTGNYGDNNEYNVIYDGLETPYEEFIKIVPEDQIP